MDDVVDIIEATSYARLSRAVRQELQVAVYPWSSQMIHRWITQTGADDSAACAYIRLLDMQRVAREGRLHGWCGDGVDDIIHTIQGGVTLPLSPAWVQDHTSDIRAAA